MEYGIFRLELTLSPRVGALHVYRHWYRYGCMRTCDFICVVSIYIKVHNHSHVGSCHSGDTWKPVLIADHASFAVNVMLWGSATGVPYARAACMRTRFQRYFRPQAQSYIQTLGWDSSALLPLSAWALASSNHEHYDDDCFYYHSCREKWCSNCVWNSLVFSYLASHSEWRCLCCLSFCRWWNTENIHVNLALLVRGPTILSTHAPLPP